MKRKTLLIFGLVTLILVTLPILADYWTCSDIPGCGGNKGCSGDVMYHYGCTMYCKTGSTTTPPIYCYYIHIPKPPVQVD